MEYKRAIFLIIKKINYKLPKFKLNFRYQINFGDMYISSHNYLKNHSENIKKF